MGAFLVLVFGLARLLITYVDTPFLFLLLCFHTLKTHILLFLTHLSFDWQLVVGASTAVGWHMLEWTIHWPTYITYVRIRYACIKYNFYHRNHIVDVVWKTLNGQTSQHYFPYRSCLARISNLMKETFHYPDSVTPIFQTLFSSLIIRHVSASFSARPVSPILSSLI